MADNPRPGSLRNLRIKRVSLVDVGANFDKHTGDGAHIVLAKSATRKDGPSLGSVHVDAPGIDVKRKKPNNKEKNVKKSIVQKVLGLFSETDATKRAAGIEEITKAMADECDDDEAMAKAKKDKEEADKLEAAKKNIDPAVLEAAIAKAVGDVTTAHRAEIEVLKAAVVKAGTEVEIEKAARLTSEMTTVLKSFRHVPVDLAKDVPVFLKMKASDPAAFDRQMEIMKGTEALLAKSALFSGFGSSASGGNDAANAWGQLEAKADAMVEKSTNGLTREAAIEKVLMDPRNMDLVKAYREVQ